MGGEAAASPRRAREPQAVRYTQALRYSWYTARCRRWRLAADVFCVYLPSGHVYSVYIRPVLPYSPGYHTRAQLPRLSRPQLEAAPASSGTGREIIRGVVSKAVLLGQDFLPKKSGRYIYLFGEGTPNGRPATHSTSDIVPTSHSTRGPVQISTPAVGLHRAACAASCFDVLRLLRTQSSAPPTKNPPATMPLMQMPARAPAESPARSSGRGGDDGGAIGVGKGDSGLQGGGGGRCGKNHG